MLAINSFQRPKRGRPQFNLVGQDSPAEIGFDLLPRDVVILISRQRKLSTIEGVLRVIKELLEHHRIDDHGDRATAPRRISAISSAAL